MNAELDFITSTWLRTFRAKLKKWYAANARDLPWRQTNDPYRIWISEIMLQQTTVAAVIPYFERFLQQFPTVSSLASAEPSEVLRLWEGLGYYSRARNIHKAAQVIVDEYNGQFPEDVDTLQQLPGIGRYTAGAIVSFGFDQRAPIVEANTLRLYSRLIGFEGDPRSSEGQNLLWDFAEAILPRTNPGNFNQALMELGGTLCSIKEPKCNLCPVRQNCIALQKGKQNRIPIPRKRPEITSVIEACVAVRKGSLFLLRKCGESERWAGMWDFPRFEISESESEWSSILSITKHKENNTTNQLFQTGTIPKTLSSQLESQVHQSTGITCNISELKMMLKHSVTRYRIQLACLTAEYEHGRLPVSREMLKWATRKELKSLPLSVTGRKFANTL